MSEEILDVVNEQDEIIGQAPRSECHSNSKLIHRVAHCWIFNFDGKILWQQRSLKKKESPGRWDMSCGGHIPSGETPYLGLLRELEEELGVTNVEPVLVTKYTAGNKKQTEMIYLFYVLVDQDAEDFKLQKDEVEQVKWFDYEEMIDLHLSKKFEATTWHLTQIPKILQSVFSKTHRRAYWKLPKIVEEVGFNFRWDVRKVWELDLPVEDMDIKELEWHFDVPFWFNKGGFYDQKPIDVINNPEYYKERIERIKSTDLKYPIDIMLNNDKWEILDGLHRLVHHKLLGHKTVKVRKVPLDSKPKILK